MQLASILKQLDLNDEVIISDDIWVDGKVENYLKKFESADLVFSNVSIIDENDSIVNRQLLNEIPKYSLLNLIFSNHAIGATIAIKRALLEKALPFPSRIPMHDQWLALMASYYGKIEYIEEPMLLYRRHLGNASYCTEESKNSFGKKIQFRIDILRCFLNRIITNSLKRNL